MNITRLRELCDAFDKGTLRGEEMRELVGLAREAALTNESLSDAMQEHIDIMRGHLASSPSDDVAFGAIATCFVFMCSMQGADPHETVKRIHQLATTRKRYDRPFRH